MHRRLHYFVAIVLLLAGCGGESVVSVRGQSDQLPSSRSGGDEPAYALAGRVELAPQSHQILWDEPMMTGPVKSRLSDKCIDASGGIGAQLTVRDCDGSPAQLVQHTRDGSLRLNGGCIRQMGDAQGSRIALEACDRLVWGMTWEYDAKSRLKAGFDCIDIEWGHRHSGAKLIVWDCHDGDNQAWLWDLSKVAPAPNGARLGPEYVIATTPDNILKPEDPRCLDTQTRQPGVNAKLVSYECHGGDSQLFRFDPGNGTTDGTIRIFGRYCLDGRLGHGQPVIFDHCNGSNTQQWYTAHLPGLDVGDNLANNSTRSGQIQNHGTGHCIDISGASTANNTSVVNWTCHTLGWEWTRGWNQMFGVGHVGYEAEAILIQRNEPPPPQLGHTGWAIELPDGRWLGGAWDGVTPWGLTPKGSYNGHWKRVYASKQEVLDSFAHGGENGQPYDWYKETVIRDANSAAAFSLEAQSWDWGYGVFGNNCLDQAVELTMSFGWQGLPWRWNAVGGLWSPNHWFDQVAPAGREKYLQRQPSA